MVTGVPLTDEEYSKYKNFIENDLENIAQIVFARDFAKRDLNFPQNDHLFDHEGGWMKKKELINERMRRYLKEFKENGISNLRFKTFYNLPDGEEDDE
jgi:hypothetical protein